MGKIGIQSSSVGTPMPKFKSGLYYGPVGVTSTVATGNNQIRLAPFWVPERTTFDKAALEITVASQAGGTARPVGFSDTGAGYPNQFLLDHNPGLDLACDAVATPEVDISWDMTPGLWWIGCLFQNQATTQCTFRSLNTSFALLPLGLVAPGNSSSGFIQSSVTTDPTPTFVSTPSNGTAPRLMLRKAS